MNEAKKEDEIYNKSRIKFASPMLKGSREKCSAMQLHPSQLNVKIIGRGFSD